MVLHFLANREEVAAVVHKMQDLTTHDGINVICAYSDKSQSEVRPYLLNPAELRALYDKWEILRFDEHKGTDLNINGPDKGKLYWRVELLARKR